MDGLQQCAGNGELRSKPGQDSGSAQPGIQKAASRNIQWELEFHIGIPIKTQQNMVWLQLQLCYGISILES